MLVQFKKATLEGKNLPGGMLARSGPFLAYLVNERKVRIFNTETGQKCSIDRTQGVIVGLAWSDDLAQAGEAFLAVLAEDGEVTIGRISPDGNEEDEGELCFEVLSILSFPEIGRARGLFWNLGGLIGGKKHLAVHGTSSSDVFFIYCSAASSIKSSFFNSSVQEIKDVTVLENRTCWVSGRDGCIERFIFTGNSYQSDFSLKLPLKYLDCIKVVEAAGVTYFLALSEKCLSIFALNRYGEPESSASLELDIAAKELVYEPNTKSLLIFAHGNRDVRIVSLAKMKAPRLIQHKLNFKSSIILDAIFKSDGCKIDESTVNVSVLFYFADSICCHNDSYEIEIVEESEYEDSFPTETEAEELENESTDQEVENVAPFFVPQDQVHNPANNHSSIDMESLKAEIKIMVREAIKESLIEVIHEALNTGIRAGFNQISEDLTNLTRTLISSVEAGTENVSPDVVLSHVNDASNDTQLIRNLIAQGQLGAAIRKASAIGNSRLLLEVCRKYEDPFTALDEEQFTQETLTQMFGLLSLDIDEDTEVKLDWLQEILIQIDFDSGIAESPQLAEQVDNLFNELKSLVNDSLVDGNLQKKMKTVMRLLRKFQMN